MRNTRIVLVSGLVTLAIGGCPVKNPTQGACDEESAKQTIAGDWTSKDGMVFHFNDGGRLASYGEKQFGRDAYSDGTTRKYTHPIYGQGMLGDYSQRTIFHGCEFSTILDRDFVTGDMVFPNQVLISGEIFGSTMELNLDYTNDDFYGAFLGDRSFELEKR